MMKIELNIDDTTYSFWKSYALSAGLPLEMLILEATRYSIQSDRLGVEETRLQALLRSTREAELSARLSKINKNHPKPHERMDNQTTPTVAQTDEIVSISTYVNDESHINMSDLEEAVTREH